MPLRFLFWISNQAHNDGSMPIYLQVSKSLSKFTKIQITLTAGGLDLKTQEDAVRRFPDVLVATPGRLIDMLVNTPSFHLQNIEILGMFQNKHFFRLVNSCLSS